MDRRYQIAPRRRRTQAAAWLLPAAVVMFCFLTPGSADDPPPTGTARFVGRYWSQSRPALNYQYGCDTGWHSFSFKAQGFFIYDGKVSGHWWLDHASNVGLLTNNGERLTLMFDGTDTLVQWRRDDKARNSPFGQEFRNYRECAAGATDQ